MSIKSILTSLMVLGTTLIPIPTHSANLSPAEAFKGQIYKVPEPCNKYVDLIEQYQGWSTSVMIKIMFLESRCSTKAKGDGHLTFGKGKYGMSCGLLQVRILPNRGVTCEDMKDPQKNIEMAYQIFQEQGYKAWSVYKKI